ncbi:unnamed protein product [Penicillium camemberti]|uniref:Str. FM013 n=1 Tax=Penicillium camemberti (strain FM 013) TaxID=1429867 RepID=A0A0G4PBS0_PENC3|nr:unnamed protein product [Penicillium camemberti]
MPYIGTPPRYAKRILTTQPGSDIGPTGRLVRRSGPILIIWFDIDADGASIGDGPVGTCWNSRKHRFYRPQHLPTSSTSCDWTLNANGCTHEPARSGDLRWRTAIPADRRLVVVDSHQAWVL